MPDIDLTQTDLGQAIQNPEIAAQLPSSAQDLIDDATGVIDWLNVNIPWRKLLTVLSVAAAFAIIVPIGNAKISAEKSRRKAEEEYADFASEFLTKHLNGQLTEAQYARRIAAEEELLAMEQRIVSRQFKHHMGTHWQSIKEFLL